MSKRLTTMFGFMLISSISPGEHFWLGLVDVRSSTGRTRDKQGAPSAP